MNNGKKPLWALLAVAALVAGWLLLRQYGLEMPDLSAQPLLAAASSQDETWGQAAQELSGGAAGELEVLFLDVGQGDSILVRAPDGDGTWNMLVDTGEYAYADGLTEALRALGVERIDALVNTHPHTDHMGCMARIVQRFEIGAVYLPVIPDDQTPTTSAYEALLKRLEEKALTPVPLREGTRIACPAALSLEVLAPDPYAVWDGLNNYSGVLRLAWGDTAFLLTGDAEKHSEQVLLYSGHDLSADVLKVGHHGSSTSTSQGFLEAVGPTIAVISCGAGNSYGHPHQETLRSLEDHGVTVVRTDTDGTIQITSDGAGLRTRTGLPSVAAREF